MGRYDAEDMLDDIQALIVSKLNAKITAVDADKSIVLDPPLETIDMASAVYRQSWSEKVLLYCPAVYYGIEKRTPIDGGGPSAEEFEIWVEIISLDNGMTADWDRRLGRYTRALKELFDENFDALSFCKRTKVTALPPASVRLELNSSEEIKIAGILLTASLV